MTTVTAHGSQARALHAATNIQKQLEGKDCTYVADADNNQTLDTAFLVRMIVIVIGINCVCSVIR